MSKRRNRERGFSLIELLIVIAIILILVAIAIPSYSKIMINGRETSARGSTLSGSNDLQVVMGVRSRGQVSANRLLSASRAEPGLHVGVRPPTKYDPQPARRGLLATHSP